MRYVKKNLLYVFAITALLLVSVFVCACEETISVPEKKLVRVHYYCDGEELFFYDFDNVSCITTDDAPIKKGYVFDGWYIDENKTVNFDKNELENLSEIRLYSGYNAIKYSINYDYRGGEGENPDEYTIESESFALAAPTRRGYRFLGWTGEDLAAPQGDLIIEKGSIGDKSFTANWQLVNYSLGYDYRGGEGENPDKYTIESDSFALVAPTRRGYRFLGWTGENTVAPQVELTIEKGGIGDKSFTANWQLVNYSLSFDYRGGEGENPDKYTIESDSFALVAPTRRGYRFLGWTGENTAVPQAELTIEKGSIGDKSFTANWQQDCFTLTYSAIDGVAIDCSSANGASLVSDEEVEISVPSFYGEYRFCRWLRNGMVGSLIPHYAFTVEADENLVAEYTQINRIYYDKSSAEDLAITSGAAVTELIGESIRQCDYTVLASGVRIDSDYLKRLSLGCHEYLLMGESGSVYYTIMITNTALGAQSIRFVYDNADFPSVGLCFDCDCGDSHYYSLNGEPFTEYEQGSMLADYDKSVDNTIEIRCGESGPTVLHTERGYSAASEAFYTSCFSYGGCYYDYAIGSPKEFYTIIEYLTLVEGVTYAKRKSGNVSDTYRYWVEDELLAYFTENESALYADAFVLFSSPMAPGYKTYVYSGNPNVFGINLSYPYGFNDKSSEQEIVILEDKQNLLQPSFRQSGCHLRVDSFPASQKICTLYELESLPFGVKPLFDDNSDGRAVEAYAVAREILTKWVDDCMNDYEKVTAIYAYLAQNTVYDYAAANSSSSAQYDGFTVYGALVGHRAVCDGFASAFKLLCNMEGIECEEYTGVQNLAQPSSSGHAWNKYVIDGVTYAADVTWARRSGYITMKYLFMDEKELITSGHFENGWLSSRFTEKAATSGFDWYSYSIIDDGYSLTVSDTDSLKAVIVYAIIANRRSIEIKYTGDISLSTALKGVAKDYSGITLSYLNLTADTYILNIAQ